jgi:hypothetical protein
MRSLSLESHHNRSYSPTSQPDVPELASEVEYLGVRTYGGPPSGDT